MKSVDPFLSQCRVVRKLGLSFSQAQVIYAIGDREAISATIQAHTCLSSDGLKSALRYLRHTGDCEVIERRKMRECRRRVNVYRLSDSGREIYERIKSGVR